MNLRRAKLGDGPPVSFIQRGVFADWFEPRNGTAWRRA